MKTILQSGPVRLVKLPKGALCNYAVLNGPKVLAVDANSRNDDDAYQKLKKAYCKAERDVEAAKTRARAEYRSPWSHLPSESVF